jgi:hypothetical protein
MGANAARLADERFSRKASVEVIASTLRSIVPGA